MKNQSNVKHIESITVHRGLPINSMNLRSYSQKRSWKNVAYWVITQVDYVSGTTYIGSIDG